MRFRTYRPTRNAGRLWHSVYLYAALSVALTGLGFAPAFAAPKEYSVGPSPEWVTRIDPEEATVVPVQQVSQGVHYLLSDMQTRIEAQDKVSYRHLAMRALNEAGVESIANVEIPFDPAYQALTLHSINVRRAGRVMPKLRTADVRILQRETELAYRIYDGSKTAHVFLDDVRVGDVVEYAYSVRGANPVFSNRQFGRFDLQWSVPVQRLHARLLVPQGREVHIAPRNTGIKPAVGERSGYREYRWETSNIPALMVDADAPGWFNPYPAVQWSEFKDWESVARWAQPLYRMPERLGPQLQAEVGRIAQSTADSRERLLAALRFVQQEIRYLGVEIGPGSHAPSSPDVVLARRFGDCKDKSLLTAAMLHALGIEARPALVNTSLRRGVLDLQPNPGAFNHVIVRARLDGRDYWVDPTASPQKAELANLAQPDFGYALVIDRDTQALSPMPKPPASMRKRSVHAVLDAQAGFDKPVRYTVTSVLEGANADAQRNVFSSENREDLQNRYLNFYARYYPGLQVAAPFKVVDDERANRITITEQYLIADFWKRADAQKRREASIYAPDMEDTLRQPRASIRSAPLSIVHPMEMTHTTEVLLPEKWSVKPEKIAVTDPAFEFETSTAYKEKQLILTDRFRSRVDHVAAADTAKYAENLERARSALGYVLYKNDSALAAPMGVMERFNWPVALVAVLLLAVWIWLARRLYRYDPLPAPAAAPLDAKLQGIGGWLVLPAIGVLLLPVRILIDFAQTVPSYAADTWAVMTMAGNASYHPMWAPVLLFELGTNLAQVVFSVLLVVLFFKKRSSVPQVFIGVTAASILVQGMDLVLTSAIPAAAGDVSSKDWIELGRNAMNVSLWATYFLMSKRVKATFVNRRSAPSPVNAAAQALA